MGKSNHRTGVRRALTNAATLGSLLLTMFASPASLGGQGGWQERRHSSGQLTIRLVIREPAAISRDQRGRPCRNDHPESQPMDIQADPRTFIARCNAPAKQSPKAVMVAATGVRTYLVKPI